MNVSQLNSLKASILTLHSVDVEHASATPNGIARSGAPSLPQLQYQGFEPSPYEEDDGGVYGEELVNIMLS
jgi:hypothetical protein